MINISQSHTTMRTTAEYTSFPEDATLQKSTNSMPCTNVQPSTTSPFPAHATLAHSRKTRYFSPKAVEHDTCQFSQNTHFAQISSPKVPYYRSKPPHTLKTPGSFCVKPWRTSINRSRSAHTLKTPGSFCVKHWRTSINRSRSAQKLTHNVDNPNSHTFSTPQLGQNPKLNTFNIWCDRGTQTEQGVWNPSIPMGGSHTYEINFVLLLIVSQYYDKVQTSDNNSKTFLSVEDITIAIEDLYRDHSYGQIDCTLKFSLEKFNESLIGNLWLNYIKNDQFRKTAQHFHSLQQLFETNIDKYDRDLTFISPLAKCAVCPNTEEMKRSQGRSVLCFTESGVRTATSFQRTCRGCHATYLPGIHENDKYKKWVTINDARFFQASQATFIETSLCKQYHIYSVHGGMALGNFITAYNILVKKNMTDKRDILASHNIKSMGQRKIDVNDEDSLLLNDSRFTEVYYMWLLNNQLKLINESLMVSSEEKGTITKEKQLKSNLISKLHTTVKPDVNVMDYFNFVFEKYENKLNLFDHEWIDQVPYREGHGKNKIKRIDQVPYPGHFVIIGDGNNKIKRITCQFPSRFQKRILDSELTTLGHERGNLHACASDQLPSNQHTLPQCVCLHHLQYLIEYMNVPVEKANLFVKYSQLVHKLFGRRNTAAQKVRKTRGKQITSNSKCIF